MHNGDILKTVPVKADLYQHQLRAVDFVCKLFGVFNKRPVSRGAALLMEMGTGKSLTSIAIAGVMFELGLITRILIVAPLSILGVWEEEFNKFADFPFNLVVLKGSSEKKKSLLRGFPKSGLSIVIINYESSWRLKDELSGYDADLIISDEGHKLKDSRTAQSKCMHVLGDRARYKLLLTGTAITNKELDIFSQYRYVNDQIFGSSFYAFRNRYFDMTGYGNHIPRFKKYMLDNFLEKMHSIAFRVRKDECLDLPDITEEKRMIDLEPKVQKLYERLEMESYSYIKNSEVTTPNILTKILRLSQITGGFITDDSGKSTAVSTAKLDALEDIIDSAIDREQKIVVMARFRVELDAIQALLDKKKIIYSVIRGGITEREDQVRRFQNDPECKVFVGQIAAAGMGITLTAASTMVFFSLDYNMSTFDQAKARIHRVGQKNNCHYIYLVAKNTIDKKVLKSLRSKIELAKLLLDDCR